MMDGLALPVVTTRRVDCIDDVHIVASPNLLTPPLSTSRPSPTAVSHARNHAGPISESIYPSDAASPIDIIPAIWFCFLWFACDVDPCALLTSFLSADSFDVPFFYFSLAI